MKKTANIVLIFLFFAGICFPAFSAEVFDTPADTTVISKEDLKAQKRAEKETAKQIKKEQKDLKKKQKEAARLEKKKQKEIQKTLELKELKPEINTEEDLEKNEITETKEADITEKRTFWGRKLFSRTEKSKEENPGVSKSVDEQKSAITGENVKQPQKEPVTQTSEPAPTDVLVDSDTIEYFPERHEFEAVGHAKVIFPSEKSTLMADKIIFNHDTNYIKGYDNVVMIKDGQRVFGDYVQIDLNNENALITKPVMHRMNIKIQAKDATVYDAKTEAMEGTAKFEGKGGMYKFTSRSVFGFNNPMLPDAIDKEYLIKEKFDNKWKLKANKIIVDSRKDHDVVTLVNTDIYLKGHKVAKAGKIKLYTDKEQNFIETNIVELGSMRNMGAYIAPSVVLPVPGGATLKIGPGLMLNDELGVGAIGRFMSETNKTAFGYGTAEDRFVMRGRQTLTDSMYVDYAINTYMNEWFMGGRMPQHGFQLVHRKVYNLDDLGVRFENRFTGGYAKDWKRNLGTMRFRWMTQTTKDFLQYKDYEHDFAAKLGLSLQSATALYGTGDTYGLVRIGPTLRTQYKNWQQYLAYYIGGEAGQSPMRFDRFYYGKSSVQLGESLRLNKYITLMYTATLALSDTPNDKMLQENRFYVALGPDDFKVLLGYDAYRQSTVFGIDMALGADNSEAEFKRMVLNEPEKIGKSNKKKTKKTVKVKNKRPVEQQKYERTDNPMDRSVRDYNDYNPGFNMFNNAIIQPSMIRPPGY